jgi:hypothetical protein
MDCRQTFGPRQKEFPKNSKTISLEEDVSSIDIIRNQMITAAAAMMIIIRYFLSLKKRNLIVIFISITTQDEPLRHDKIGSHQQKVRGRDESFDEISTPSNANGKIPRIGQDFRPRTPSSYGVSSKVTRYPREGV